MITDEMNEFRKELPSRILDARLDRNDMLVIHCQAFRVGIACDFEINLSGKTFTTPADHLEAVNRLKLLNVQGARLEYRIDYPDLRLELDDCGYIRTISDSVGNELWYIDVPGGMFITP